MQDSYFPVYSLRNGRTVSYMKEFMLSITLSQLSSAEIEIDRLKINNFHTDAGLIIFCLFIEEC